jgi:hypothetical protein
MLLMMMSRAIEMNCPWHSITKRLWEALYDESASCGLDADIGFMRCCGMRTLAYECLVVPVACGEWRFSKQCSSRAAASPWVFVSAVPVALAKDCCPREKIFKA